MRFDADTLMNAADMLGTVAFSISGAMTAIQRGLDLFGVFHPGHRHRPGGRYRPGHYPGPVPLRRPLWTGSIW